VNASRQAGGGSSESLLQSGALNAERHEGEERRLKYALGRWACPGSGVLK